MRECRAIGSQKAMPGWPGASGFAQSRAVGSVTQRKGKRISRVTGTPSKSGATTGVVPSRGMNQYVIPR